MKSCLVTGAGGFVGANLVLRLLSLGHRVHVLLKPESDPWRLKRRLPDLRVIEGDLSDAAAIRNAVRDSKPEWIFHLAAHGAYSHHTDSRMMLDTNLHGTTYLLDACRDRGFEAFVNAGSSSEYGFKGHAPPETEFLEPNSHYALTKGAATAYCGFIARTHDIHAVTLRIYSAYGPYESPTRLVPTLLVRGIAKGLPPLVNPAIARDYIYIDDVLDAFLLVAQHTELTRGTIYNLGTGTQTTLSDIVALVRTIFGITSEPEWGSMPDRGWDTQIWVANIDRIARELGWQPRTGLEAGLRATLAWLQREPEMLDYYKAALTTQRTSK